MPEKRPHPPGGVENDDFKRVRSVNGSPSSSPAPPPAAANGESDEGKKKAASERIAALRARLAGNRAAPVTGVTAPAASSNAPSQEMRDKLAAMTAKFANGGTARAGPEAHAASPPSQVVPNVQDRVTALEPRLAHRGAATGSGSTSASPSASPAPLNDMQAQVRAQIAAIRAKAAQSRAPVPVPVPAREDTSLQARGGLNVGLHPSLLGEAGKSRPGQDKGKQGERAQVNPYITDESLTAEQKRNDAYFDAALAQGSRERKSRQLLFNQKGKFIAQANALRQQERLEEMKRRLQEEARKKAIEEATEKSYLVPAPPDIEWWDEGLIAGDPSQASQPKNYDNIDTLPAKITYDVITPYVQHPVLLAAPQEMHMPAPKPMFLTKKEQKKVRRQRRMADHKEEQAKIRLGLKAPPAPKVKKSNLMRVLGQEAVKDPTAVEARVNREIAERAEVHETMNAERALTKEQRHEKLKQQQEADAAKGISMCVFRVENLSYPKHRFQISKNAEQNELSGITIFNPGFNLVIVEGGAHSINAYKKLMLNRIKWTENAAPVGERSHDSEASWMRNVDERSLPKDFSHNRCQLVFEGLEKQRSFKRWNPYKVCETDGEAKDTLGRYKMENMWTLAQSMEGNE